MIRRVRLRPTARYVTVQVKGSGLEAFLNLCVREAIQLWDVERPGRHMLVARMQARDFARLRTAARRPTWRARIIGRHGGGFLFTRLLRRPSFLTGAVAAAVIWYVLSSYIWFVKVEGTERVATERILEAAGASGLSPGVRAASVDPDRLQRELLLAVDELIWAGVEVRGTQAVIRVAERRAPDLLADGPGHIVAARDGVIERISVLNGVAVVAPGETVRRGQLLISGEALPGSPVFAELTARGLPPYQRAAGSVYALVWYEAEAEAFIGDEGLDKAVADATEVALALARRQLLANRGEERGEPTIEIEEGVNGGSSVRVRAVIQGVQEIGRYEPLEQ